MKSTSERNLERQLAETQAALPAAQLRAAAAQSAADQAAALLNNTRASFSKFVADVSTGVAAGDLNAVKATTNTQRVADGNTPLP